MLSSAGLPRQERATPPPARASATRIADGIVEAGWLVALAVVPVFFNIQSGRPFEPDKTALLRLLALLMAAGGVARAVEERVAGAPRATAGPRWRESPLLLCAALYLGSATLSTVFSIVPRLSLWGSHTRLEGLVTLLAHLTVFLSLATRLRRRAQLDRLLAAAIASSVPVCLYAIVQRLGRDPLDWQVAYQEWRVSTTLGNPIFAGEYLALLLPLTLGAAAWWWPRRVERGGFVRVALAVAAAALQVVGLGLTGSRGPWLGAAVALAALLLLTAAARGQRRLAGATLAAGLAGLVFLGLLNVPDGPLEPLRRTAALGRLGRLFADSEGRNPGDRARVLVWQGALRLPRLPAPIVVPGRGPDGAAGLRSIVGFGPETLQGVFGAVYDPAFAAAERRNPDVSAEGTSTFSTRVPDRSHNETLDSLALGGVLGVLAYLLLHAAAQLTALGALGLAATRREAVLLAGACATGALLVTLVARVALSWAYLGVAIPLGLVAGWMVFVVVAALRRREAGPPRDAALVGALAAALLGHFVAMQFGPAVVTGRLYFWAYAGLLVALARPGGLDEAAEESAGPAWDAARAALPALALGLAIAFGFAGLKASGGGRPGYGLIALLAGATLATYVALAEARMRPALWAAGSAALVTAAFAELHLQALGATSLVRSLDALVASLSGHFTRIALALLAATLGLGIALAGAVRGVPAAGWVRLAAALGLTLGLAVPATLGSVNADVLRHFAATFQARSRLAEAVALCEAATRLAPSEAIHHKALGEALLQGARPGEPRNADLLKRAEAAFARAQALDPLSSDHAVNRARLARRRAELAPDPAAARREAETAARFYADALALVPGNTLLLDEAAELEYQRLGDFAAAEARLNRSLALDPTFEYTHVALGDLYLARARAQGSREDYARAVSAYEQGLARRFSLKSIISVGIASREMGDAPAAIRAFEHALTAPPPPSVAWTLHEQLAALYRSQGDEAAARGHAQRALSNAPPGDKAALEARLRAGQLLPGS
jgi:tetratricopeptide (TPR) repeat protein